MLIKFQELLNNYNINVKGILHVGAHECEELNDYMSGGCNKDKIIWLEGNPNLVNKIKNKDKNIKVYNYLVSNQDDIETTLNIANNGQSSSILELGTHKHHHPHVHYNGEITLKTKTIDSIYKLEHIPLDFANFLNIDIQGAELLAIKGMKDILKQFDYLYLEVNREHLYINSALIDEIDEYVSKYNFKRVQTSWTQYNWGDAFYIKY